MLSSIYIVFDFDLAAANSPVDRIALAFAGGGYFDFNLMGMLPR